MEMQVLFLIIVPFTVLVLPGIVMALPLRLASVKKLRSQNSGIARGLSLILACSSFVISFLAVTHFRVELQYVFFVMEAKLNGSGDYPDESYKEVIIKEMWHRAVRPPVFDTCYTDHAAACEFADVMFVTSWGRYLVAIGMSLIAVVVNQRLIRRWGRVGDENGRKAD